MNLSPKEEGERRKDCLLTASRRAGLTFPSAYLVVVLLRALPASAVAQGFDHEHRAWNALLKQHVVLVDGGKASRVRYTDFQNDRAALKAYTESLARISDGEFRSWSRE